MAVHYARHGNIRQHKIWMVLLKILALLVTGVFPLWPGRAMHGVFFGVEYPVAGYPWHQCVLTQSLEINKERLVGMISGACFCKAVQYELLTESQTQGLCYCTDCQVVGGSSHWAFYAVAPSDFRLLEGILTAYTYDPGSGREVTRHFCGTCGTQIMVQSDELGVASLNAMTFCDATRFTPHIAYFGASAPRWCKVDPRLTAFGDAE